MPGCVGSIAATETLVQVSSNAFGAGPEPDALFPEDPAVTMASEAIYDWDLSSDEITWSPSYALVPGLPSPDLVATGLGFAEHLAAESPSSRYEAIMAPGGCDAGGGVIFKAVYGLVEHKRAQTSPVWVEDTGRWFADAGDRPSRVHGVIRVITERYEAERRRTVSAQRDQATGVFNRAFFVEHLSRHLSLAARKSSTFAVLLIGIDLAGSSESVGEEQLVEAVARMRLQMRSHEVVARHSGTKFAVLLETCNETQAAAAAERLIAAIADAAAEPRLSPRVGSVIAPAHGRTPQALLQFAEEALEAARQPTGPNYVRYEPGLSRAASRPPVRSSDEILVALNEGRVALALQPIVDARTRKVVFFEGLVRVVRPDGPPIMPDALVANAERDGLVSLIDRRVIEVAFALMTGDRKLHLSINASPASVADPCWFEHLRTASRLRPDAARRLTIEVTETCAIGDLNATRVTLAAIKPLGIKLAIDDFGSGHSSFKTLRQLPVDFLKIDGAFCQNLASSQDDRFFIRTLIDLARNLKIPTVAEWVEDEETARILTEWGIDYLQGHLFGKAQLAEMPTTGRSGSR